MHSSYGGPGETGHGCDRAAALSVWFQPRLCGSCAAQIAADYGRLSQARLVRGCIQISQGRVLAGS